MLCFISATPVFRLHHISYSVGSKIDNTLTVWGRVTHISVSKLTILGSDNGLSPDRHQAIIWTNAGLLLIGPLGTNFSEILIEILIFSSTEMRLKVSSAKRRPFCLGLNVFRVERCLIHSDRTQLRAITVPHSSHKFSQWMRQLCGIF